MNKVEFRDRLREAMEIRGLRSVDLVEKTGIPKVTISYYLSGTTKPRSDKLYLLAQALDVNEAWLHGYDVPMARTNDQKKNDQLAELIVRLRADEAFYDTVVALAELDGSQYEVLKQLVATLKK